MRGKFHGDYWVDDIDGVKWKIYPRGIGFWFAVEATPKYVIVEIPDGFTTDYASIPRFLWSWLPPAGDGKCFYGPAAIIHDYLYIQQEVNGEPITREWADEVFLAALEALNVVGWKATMMYSAVRIFGRSAWNKHIKSEEEDGIVEE